MAMTKEEKRIFERDERARKAKEKIRKESKAGMYEGGGPGEAQGRKMATIVEKDDKVEYRSRRRLGVVRKARQSL